MMAGVQKRKIRWVIFLFLVMLYFSGLTAQAQYGGGSGEPNDPYLIYTAEQMNAIGANSNDWDEHFKLMADIDLSAYTGTSFNIIGSFRGVFDGNGHTISNFSYTSTDTDRIGLFGYVEGGTIKDLGLIDPNVDAGTEYYVGSLVGQLSYGTVSGCYAKGGSVTGGYRVGGLVGENRSGGTITNCYATGSVSGETNVGGLVGDNGYSSTITRSYATSPVTGVNSVGGLVGNNDNILTHCYATGSVSGATNVGDLVGENRSGGTITNCYATGSVSASGTEWWPSVGGGLVGENRGEVTDSFWDIQTSGQVTSAGGMGKTTAEMQNPNTFMDAGWDFVDKSDGPSDIWAEPAGGGYPILWWQLSPPPELPTFSGGTGEPDDPYLVSTAADLNSIGHNPRLMRAHFKLTNDIDLAGIDFYIIGSEAFPFTGVFDGNGHTISNLSYTSTDTNYVGLFGYVYREVIKDLGLINPNVDAGTGRWVGSLVGELSFGTISNCYAEGGSVTGRYDVGGLVGRNYGTITNCYSSASVSGDDRVGGLVGYNRGTITDCYATGSILGNTTVGGLVGGLYSGRITNCYSAGNVMGDGSVGGLVGTNSYSTTIADCYSTSSVVGIEHVGGLVGTGGGAHNSFWDVQTSGQTTSAGGKGRTTAQMQMASTFLGWRCGNEGVWTIDEGNDYPRLWWENKPGEVLDTQQLSAFLTGAGTDDEPYLIYTAEELNVIGVFPCEWDKQFKLMSDIDLSHYMGTEFNIIGITSPFTGVFDGNGKKITNLNHTRGLFVSVSGAIKDLGLIDFNIDAGTGSSVGSLVGWQTEDGTITDCYVEGGSVLGNRNVGGLVGNNSGTITNCYAEGGSVSGLNSVGGLVGRNTYGTITGCYVDGGSVSGNIYVGGLVGENGNGYYGTITNCYATGSVSGNNYVGGLVGENSDGTITNCYATGSVTGDDYVGGLVGSNEGTISNCYATGSVSGDSRLGGLVGRNGWYGLAGTITNCYATGSVSASGTERLPGVGGGLVGENRSGGTITNCYATGSVSASGTEWWPSVGGGLVGENRGEVTDSFWDIQTSGQVTSAGGTGKTTVEMQTESTFTDAGWDFVAESVNGTEDTWCICEGVDYPRLTWQFVIGDFDGDAKVGFADFAIFATHWLATDSSFFCGDGGTDLTNDGRVDFNDLREFAENWLQPQPPEPQQPPPPPGSQTKGRTCFLADTPVWVNGALVQISNVVSGQMVSELHCDLATDCLEQIETVEEHEGTFECRDIVLESGNRISVVDAHCFMLDSGQWIAAQDLRSGLRLKTLSGTVGIKSVAIRAVPFVGKVYNLKITGVDRYLVSEDGVIVRDY